MSLKVWKLDGGKLSQTQVVSGSWDCNLIVWDINTGSDLHLLSGHLGKVTCVKVTGDGTIAVSALTSLSLHVPLLGFQITSDCSRIVIHLLDRELRPLAPKRPMRRLLKKEVSLDTYTWQKKYGHLTSAAMMAQVSLGPEQAAIAQSQHFDELESLWNKVSPPRRRSNKTLAKQSSLIESRYDSSDEEHTPVEEQ
ncbi:putative WD repeat-containing protein, partial [Operophtera brumata]